MSAVRPMRLLDERYVVSSITVDLARLVSTVRVDGGLRRPDGSVDMERIRDVWRRVQGFDVRFRQVLRGLPLGLMVPAWVDPGPTDVEELVALHPVRVSADAIPADLLAGAGNPRSTLRNPLWSTLVIDLDDGGLILVCSGHHAIGDGLVGLQMVLSLMTETPDPLPVMPLPPATAPRTPVGLAVGAWRSWWAEQGRDLRTAIADFVRKPLRMRVRRMGGRIVRRPRDLALRLTGAAASHMPARHYAVRSFDGTSVRRLARAAGVGVNDLIVAAAGRAAATLDGEASGVLVPIADGIGRTQSGNRVRVALVRVDPAASLADAAQAVRHEVRLAIDSGARTVPAPGSWSGYATTLTGPVRPRYIAAERVTELFLWPNIGVAERFGVLGFSYCGRFTIGVVTDGSLSVEALADAVADELDATVPA